MTGRQMILGGMLGSSYGGFVGAWIGDQDSGRYIDPQTGSAELLPEHYTQQLSGEPPESQANRCSIPAQ